MVGIAEACTTVAAVPADLPDMAAAAKRNSSCCRFAWDSQVHSELVAVAATREEAAGKAPMVVVVVVKKKKEMLDAVATGKAAEAAAIPTQAAPWSQFLLVSFSRFLLSLFFSFFQSFRAHLLY